MSHETGDAVILVGKMSILFFVFESKLEDQNFGSKFIIIPAFVISVSRNCWHPSSMYTEFRVHWGSHEHGFPGTCRASCNIPRVFAGSKIPMSHIGLAVPRDYLLSI